MGLFSRKKPDDAPKERHRPSRKVSKRQYSAALSQARYGDLVASFGSADAELAGSLATVRAKARFHLRNSGTMKRYVQLMRENIVGENGFVFQCRVRTLVGELDVGLNDRVKAEWDSFFEKPCVNRTLSGVDLLNMTVSSLCVDGEVIWEIVPRSDAPHGVLVNPIEADMLDESKTVDLANGNRVKMGVEIDTDNNPVAYWFLTEHPGDIIQVNALSRERHRRIPADRILHAFDAQRPGQTRGEPPSSAVINSLKSLDGYRESEVVGRRMRAVLGVFFQRAMEAVGGIGALADGVGSPEGGDPREEFDVNEIYLEPGMMHELPAGVEAKELSPGGWQSDFKDADGQFKKDVSMGLGISNVALGMETEGISYSTHRGVIQEDRDHYRAMQGFLVRKLMRPLFFAFLSYNAMSPDTQIPPTRLGAIRKAFKFRPRGWDWVDPLKDVKANADAIATGQTSLARIAAQRGLDSHELLIEIEEDVEFFKRRGWTHPLLGDKTEQSADNDTSPDDEDEQDED